MRIEIVWVSVKGSVKYWLNELILRRLLSQGNRCTHEWDSHSGRGLFFCQDHRVQKLFQSNLSVKKNVLLSFQRNPHRAIVILITASVYELWVQGIKVRKSTERVAHLLSNASSLTSQKMKNRLLLLFWFYYAL